MRNKMEKEIRCRKTTWRLLLKRNIKIRMKDGGIKTIGNHKKKGARRKDGRNRGKEGSQSHNQFSSRSPCQAFSHWKLPLALLPRGKWLTQHHKCRPKLQSDGSFNDDTGLKNGNSHAQGFWVASSIHFNNVIKKTWRSWDRISKTYYSWPRANYLVLCATKSFD